MNLSSLPGLERFYILHTVTHIYACLLAIVLLSSVVSVIYESSQHMIPVSTQNHQDYARICRPYIQCVFALMYIWQPVHMCANVMMPPELSQDLAWA